MIQQESEFKHTNPDGTILTSPDNAKGAMQVVPAEKAAAQDCVTAKIISNLNEVDNLEKNIRCGVYYLYINHKEFGSTGVTRANGIEYTGWQASLAKYVGVGRQHPNYVEEVVQKCLEYDISCPYEPSKGLNTA